MKPDIAEIRKEYTLRRLNVTEVDDNPFIQFNTWLDEAIYSEVIEPTAMCLSTAGKNMMPSSRMVLLKKTDENGFSFFTNYESNKARQLDENPLASLLFFWPELERQIRIEGKTVKVTEKESDEYFASRPAGSRLGAWASPQSKPIKDRVELEKLLEKTKEFFADKEPYRPRFWGGYRLVPDLLEFWQGRENRLHDRIRYKLYGKMWEIERLAP